ncbi:carbapenem self-resistance protein CarG family protein, partial [Photorhabdus temperata]
IFIFSFNAFSCNGRKVNLKNGSNFIDLNSDGIKDVVFYAEFENNTSHPSNTLTFFIKNAKGKFNIIPLPNDTGFTWFDFKLSASEIKVQDYELRVKNGVYYIILSIKQKKGDIFESSPIEFIIYKMAYNDADAGISDYYWAYFDKFVTKRKYKSVNDAISEFHEGCNL